jgi:2-dehydro-3-deoxy-D-gluconate 5-dehydrogenase
MILEVFQLDGKNALLTGSHTEFGAAMAVAPAQAGANVACHGSDPNPGKACEEIHALGRKETYFAGDVADAGICLALIEKTVAAFGSIDILINNAGMIRSAPAAECPAGYWGEAITVNLTAVFRLSQLAGQLMLWRAKQGKIVNIASVLSFQGGNPGACLRRGQKRSCATHSRILR